MRQGNRRLVSLINRKGLTLVEMVMALAILSIVTLSIASLNVQMANQLTRQAELSEIDIFRRKLMRALQNDLGWRQSLNQPQNATHAQCLLMPGRRCSNTFQVIRIGPNSSMNPRLAVYSGSGLDDETLLDAPSTAPSAGPIFDATDPRNGITLTGKKCGPHASSPQLRLSNYPSVSCPLRFDIRWYAVASTNPSPPTPLVAVYAFLIVSPQAGLVINTSRYSIGTCSGRNAAGACIAIQSPIYRTAL